MERSKSIPQITLRRAAVCLAGIALAVGAGTFLAGCGGDKQGDQPSVEPTMTEAPQAEATVQPTPTTQAERRWAFRGTRLIRAAFPPADLALYRSLLPSQLDMPDEPLVVMTVANYYDVTLPLVPYREGYVLLQCKYQGRTGWYTYTMPVDDETANAGGRAIGFNKYVADEITLEEQDGVWTGRVVYEGRTVMEITLTPEGEPVEVTGAGEEVVLFNLLPPGEGPGLIEVNSNRLGEQTTVTTSGSATVKADAGQPWAGLLDPEGSTPWAVFQEETGDSVLEWKTLE
jgi:hypothetical protein